ncbi:hypothetical protein H0H92_007353 [Tricholoma furcatifolium]|nr:hypothetical protein H0H92_007353 [Tricholoma furcatifolium]
MANIFIDQTSPDLRINQATTEQTLSSTTFMGGTALSIVGASDVAPSISFKFNGKTASFYGQFISVLSPAYVPLNVVIDGVPEKSNHSTSAALNAIGLFYATPILSNGQHTVNITFDQVDVPCVVDFITVTAPTNGTPISSQQFIIDDDDPSVLYEGSWTKNQSTISNNDQWNRLPYGGGMHQSSSPGSTVTFSFNGTSITVYGVPIPSTSPELQLAYSMDDAPPSLVSFGADQFLVPNPNFPWYMNDTLPPGSHTLKLEIMIASDMNFTVDYAIYTGSIQSNAASSTTATTHASSVKERRVALIGPLIGSIAGIFIVVIILLYYKRKSKVERSKGLGEI